MYPTPSFQSPTAIHVAMTTSQCQQPSRVGSGVRILPTTAMPSYSLMELSTTQQRQAIKIMSATQFIQYVKAHPQRFPGG